MQIHNRYKDIIVRQITSKFLVSEEGMSNVLFFKSVENKKRESKQREEEENAERRGKETERRGREGRD